MMKSIVNRIASFIRKWTLWEILRGMSLTFLYMFKSKSTQKYPYVETPVSPRFRGMLALRSYPNGQERCIACKLCEATCPANAITIDAKMGDDGVRRTTKFDIDIFKCIYCGLCEQACPVDSIVLTSELHYHCENRGENIFTKEKLLKIGEIYEDQIVKDRFADKDYR